MTPGGRLSAEHQERQQTFMGMALRLARRAQRRTWPNPMVGAVVVKGDRVLGCGFHKKAGKPHAEVEALEQAGKTAKGADLYTTLEPCHLTGRTGPCTDRIMKAGIRRVFVGACDPNPCERGRSVALLQKAGIEVHQGILEKECCELNEVYNVFIQKRRPFVLVKAAASLDGRIAAFSGDSHWISGPESRRQSHRLRAISSAVLVGVGTVQKDDPRLDVRLVAGKNPAVVVLDTNLTISLKSRLLHINRGATVFVYHGPGVSRNKKERLLRLGIQLREVPMDQGLLSWDRILEDLFSLQIYQLMVEGGSTVIGSLLSHRLVDRIEIFSSPCLLGSNAIPLGDFPGPKWIDRAPRLVDCRWRRFGNDICCSGFVSWGQKERD